MIYSNYEPFAVHLSRVGNSFLSRHQILKLNRALALAPAFGSFTYYIHDSAAFRLRSTSIRSLDPRLRLGLYL